MKPMFLEDLDLLGEGPVEFRAMVVRDFMDLEMTTMRLVSMVDDSHVFMDTNTGDIYSRSVGKPPDLVFEKPHHMEIVKQDWEAFQKKIRILRLLFRWFVEGRLEEIQLYPFLYEVLLLKHQ